MGAITMPTHCDKATHSDSDSRVKVTEKGEDEEHSEEQCECEVEQNKENADDLHDVQLVEVVKLARAVVGQPQAICPNNCSGILGVIA